MIFRETALGGVFQVDIERKSDERGFFARTWCRDEFGRLGLATEFVQGSVSFNPFAGTLRGLHFQRPPHRESKLVRCIRGAIYDVIVDLRPGSPTHGRWLGIELTGTSHRALYIPEGFAHGFQTLDEDTEVFYLISAFHEPKAAGGLRYDDPALGIRWPKPISRISDADKSWPTLEALSPV